MITPSKETHGFSRGRNCFLPTTLDRRPCETCNQNPYREVGSGLTKLLPYGISLVVISLFETDLRSGCKLEKHSQRTLPCHGQ